MPGRDGTGPSTVGRGLGRYCRRQTDSRAMAIFSFLLENWRPIAGFLLTVILPLLSRKLRVPDRVSFEKTNLLPFHDKDN